MTHNPAGQIVARAGAHNAYRWNAPVGVRDDTHNGLNQILTAGGTAVTHDARGNMTSDGFLNFAYSSDNLMTQGAGASLFYDPLDRLRFVQEGGNEQRVYDGGELIMEYDMNGTSILRRYVHGPGTDEPLVWYEGAGTTDRRWLHADERGSIIGAFNSSGGGLGYVAYDEYGRRQVWGNPGRFGYTGQQWLPEIGMHYYRARMYDQDGGRFMQADPIGYGDGMNLYAYVGGDPVNGRDPSGTCITVGTMSMCDDGEGNLHPVSSGFSGDFIRVGGLLSGGGYEERDRGGSDRRRNSQGGGTGGTGGRVQLACAGPLVIPCGKVIADALVIMFGAYTVTHPPAVYNRPPRDATKPNGARAPGRPGATEGFRPPRPGQSEWGRAPGGGYGWIDSRGNVWVPTGPGNQGRNPAHGGPHWDVVSPDGRHTNRYPGGRSR